MCNENKYSKISWFTRVISLLKGGYMYCAMTINILRYGLQELFPFKVGKMVAFHAKYMCNENNI